MPENDTDPRSDAQPKTHTYICWIEGDTDTAATVRNVMGPETAARTYIIGCSGILRGMHSIDCDRTIHMVMVCRADEPTAVKFSISVRPGT